MEQIVKIAVKTSKPGSKVKPIDKILMFLKQEEQALKDKHEKQKEKAIKEIMSD